MTTVTSAHIQYFFFLYLMPHGPGLHKQFWAFNKSGDLKQQQQKNTSSDSRTHFIPLTYIEEIWFT